MSNIADAFTTDNALQIGNGTMVHENVGGGTTESAFPQCGTKRNPRSRYSLLVGSTYVVTCEKCRIAIDKANKLAAQQEREANMAAVEAAVEAQEEVEADLAANPVAEKATWDRKIARLASLKDRLEAATSRRVARGETTANKSEMTLAQKIEGVEAWVASHN